MRPNVLIAEDDTALQSLFAKVFDYAGFDVACVGDGDEALEQIDEALPNVIILDVNMPGRSGLQIMDYLHEANCLNALQTVIVTANPIAAKTAQAEYADLVLIKPVDAYALVALAERLLASVPTLKGNAHGKVSRF